MRIAFFGKGGSGKTTLAAGYTKYLSNQGETVLAIDADHNQHLGETIGIEPSTKIGNHEDQVNEYVKGERKETIISSTPPSEKSNFIRLNQENTLLTNFTDEKDNIKLLTVGSYEKEDKGATCYHGKQDALALLLNHLLDTKEHNIVTDGTAGVDTYGSALATSFDINIFVIEPTKKAISVYKEFKDLTKDTHSDTYAVINKIENEDDKRFVEDHISVTEILGYLYRSAELRRFEQGQQESFDIFVEKNKELFKRIKQKGLERGKNWKEYLDNLKEIHRGVSKSWYDEYYNEPISQQADTTFSYQDIIHEDKTRNT